MKKLAPRCSEFMLRCVWKGKPEKCIEQEKMFEEGATANGHCCLFNLKTTYDEFTMILLL